MSTRKERQLIWEIQQAQAKILPISGVGARTVTLIDIGKSWSLHEPLHELVSRALGNYVNYMHCIDPFDKKHYLERIEADLEEFWEINEENFNEDKNRRPNYLDV